MLKDICPVCGKEYQYIDKGWKQKTCGSYECVTKFFAQGADLKQDTTLFSKDKIAK